MAEFTKNKLKETQTKDPYHNTEEDEDVISSKRTVGNIPVKTREY